MGMEWIRGEQPRERYAFGVPIVLVSASLAGRGVSWHGSARLTVLLGEPDVTQIGRMDMVRRAVAGGGSAEADGGLASHEVSGGCAGQR